MNKSDAIIRIFSDSPETWTAEQLEEIKKQTGENISRDILRRAYNVRKNNLYKHIATALNESIEETGKRDFSGRLFLLITEIFPAIEMLEDLRKRIEQETDKTTKF